MARDSTTGELAKAVSAHLSFTNETTESQIRIRLSTYPPELITRLETMLSSGSRAASFVATAVDDGANASFVSEMLAFTPYLRTESSEVAKGAIKSLHRYDQLPSMDDYGSAPEEVQRKCRAILVVTEALDEYHYYHGDGKLPLAYILNNKNYNDSFMVLQGDALIDLILENPADATRISDIMIERLTGDAELIREIMSQHDSKALNPGII